jgi:hypothetical protein
LGQIVRNECCTNQDGRSSEQAVHHSLILHN